MMEFGSSSSAWSFETAISILRTAAADHNESQSKSIPTSETSWKLLPVQPVSQGGLGDFTEVWKQLGLVAGSDRSDEQKLGTSFDSETSQLAKAVKWRDEYDGADLEDNVEPEQVTASNLRTRKRAARRARARERELQAAQANGDITIDSATDGESGEELEVLRRSPDRRALIADLVGRPRPDHSSPPTSPSPPKANSVLRTPVKKEWPVANPFLWTAPGVPSPAAVKSRIAPTDRLTSGQRKIHLISQLSTHFPDDQKYLRNVGLLEPAFTPLNTSPIGVHVFIDMSNISIGFHDCLKLARGIPVSTRVKRIPMNFHNLSLILERGRPAAKRVLAGSDRSAIIDQAETCGYEANVLDRVHKAKTPTPKQKKYRNNGYNSASGVSHGETSGSETPGHATYKWSEQGVDEILHLKLAQSLLDTEKPSTIVLATGDAAEAEYSDGFLRMVERALSKSWQVEVWSFRANCSSLYRRSEFRQKWGSMFRWIPLDPYVEMLIEDEP